MQHPLEFVAPNYRQRLFFLFLAFTLVIFAVFRVLDQPLRTATSPNGIVSFELARTPQRAQSMIDVWSGRTTIYSDGVNSNAFTVPPGEPFVYNAVPMLSAAFGLGLDYLFMPLYAMALSLGTLLAAQKHTGWFRSLGAVAGYGAIVAALFDAVENFSLWQILLGASESGYPAIAAFCATVKFALLVIGLGYALVGWLLKKTAT
jgi:hypothetical protein